MRAAAEEQALPRRLPTASPEARRTTGRAAFRRSRREAERASASPEARHSAAVAGAPAEARRATPGGDPARLAAPDGAGAAVARGEPAWTPPARFSRAVSPGLAPSAAAPATGRLGEFSAARSCDFARSSSTLRSEIHILCLSCCCDCGCLFSEPPLRRPTRCAAGFPGGSRADCARWPFEDRLSWRGRLADSGRASRSPDPHGCGIPEDAGAASEGRPQGALAARSLVEKKREIHIYIYIYICIYIYIYIYINIYIYIERERYIDR